MPRPKVVALLGDRSEEVISSVLEELRDVEICLFRLRPPPKSRSGVRREVWFGDGEVCEVRPFKGGLPDLILSTEGCRVVLIDGPAFAPTIVADSDPSSLGEVPYLVGVVGPAPPGWGAAPVVEPGEVGRFIMERVPEYPAMLNCGECGYRTCAEFLREAVRGREVRCVVEQRLIDLEVDERRVQLVPFMEAQLRTLALAYLSTLKGVPNNPRRVVLKMNLEGGNL